MDLQKLHLTDDQVEAYARHRMEDEELAIVVPSYPFLSKMPPFRRGS